MRFCLFSVFFFLLFKFSFLISFSIRNYCVRNSFGIHGLLALPNLLSPLRTAESTAGAALEVIRTKWACFKCLGTIHGAVSCQLVLFRSVRTLVSFKNCPVRFVSYRKLTCTQSVCVLWPFLSTCTDMQTRAKARHLALYDFFE